MSTPKEAVIDFVAGGVAGAASVVVGHPADTVKIRLQLFGAERYSGPVDCFAKLVQEEGFFALFRGLFTPLASQAFINSLMFLGYSSALKLMAGGEDKATHLQRMVAGGVAAMPQSFILCPTDLIKIRLQQDTTQYTGVRDCFMKTYRTGGITSLFQGQCATLMRDMPALSCYFSSYYFFNTNLKTCIQSEVTTSFIAGALAGAASWIIVYPMDVAKSTIQGMSSTTPLKDRRVFTVLKNIQQHHGFRQLYRGLGIALIRSLPVNAVVFPVYEGVKRLLEKL